MHTKDRSKERRQMWNSLGVSQKAVEISVISGHWHVHQLNYAIAKLQHITERAQMCNSGVLPHHHQDVHALAQPRDSHTWT